MEEPNRLGSPHEHVFLGADHGSNERRTWIVIALTTVMMVIEIAAGTVYGSMALVADGWHMATHAAALTITALAYVFARRNARNPNFTFGTGKFGDLAGFASAVLLALIALQIGVESGLRLYAPVAIDFSQAILVAVVGLAVNLLSAWLLGGHSHDHGGHGHHDHGHADHEHGHDDHDHDHAHDDHGHGRRSSHADDNNLRAAYLHVITDALTSVLAIVALVLGRAYGWVWLDPLIGVVGAVIIARWSWGLIRDSGARLLDYLPGSDELPGEIRQAIEVDGDKVTDLHVWRLGPGHIGAIVAIRSAQPKTIGDYRQRLAHIDELSHLTVEVEAAA